MCAVDPHAAEEQSGTVAVPRGPQGVRVRGGDLGFRHAARDGALEECGRERRLAGDLGACAFGDSAAERGIDDPVETRGQVGARHEVERALPDEIDEHVDRRAGPSRVRHERKGTPVRREQSFGVALCDDLRGVGGLGTGVTRAEAERLDAAANGRRDRLEPVLDPAADDACELAVLGVVAAVLEVVRFDARGDQPRGAAADVEDVLRARRIRRQQIGAHLGERHLAQQQRRVVVLDHARDLHERRRRRPRAVGDDEARVGSMRAFEECSERLLVELLRVVDEEGHVVVDGIGAIARRPQVGRPAVSVEPTAQVGERIRLARAGTPDDRCAQWGSARDEVVEGAERVGSPGKHLYRRIGGLGEPVHYRPRTLLSRHRRIGRAGAGRRGGSRLGLRF